MLIHWDSKQKSNYSPCLNHKELNSCSYIFLQQIAMSVLWTPHLESPSMIFLINITIRSPILITRAAFVIVWDVSICSGHINGSLSRNEEGQMLSTLSPTLAPLKIIKCTSIASWSLDWFSLDVQRSFNYSRNSPQTCPMSWDLQETKDMALTWFQDSYCSWLDFTLTPIPSVLLSQPFTGE